MGISFENNSDKIEVPHCVRGRIRGYTVTRDNWEQTRRVRGHTGYHLLVVKGCQKGHRLSQMIEIVVFIRWVFN